MKKYFIFALAVLLVFAFTLPAAAVEHIFGGYHRTRFATQQNFTGEDLTGSQDVALVDYRTRLYYTAVLNDNLKLVNKFEFNTTWGDRVGGDIGADGMGIWRIKNSYIDFNLADYDLNFKVGTQSYTQSRGFFFADDFSGMVVTYKGDNFTLPFVWMKRFEGSTGTALDDNDQDVDLYMLDPKFAINDLQVNPFVVWATSDDVRSWNANMNTNSTSTAFYQTAWANGWVSDVDNFYLGVNLDYKADTWSVWGTFIYQTGDIDLAPGLIWPPVTGETSMDVDAYLVAFGGSMQYNDLEIHGQFFYATGDENPNDSEINDFFVSSGARTAGQSYYWAEIMGYGIFDQQCSFGSPQDKISNIQAFMAGITFTPFEKISLTLNVWSAELAEDNMLGNNELGTEIDAIVAYTLVEGLKMEVVGGILFAGDASTKNWGMGNEADPYELGVRLELSF